MTVTVTLRRKVTDSSCILPYLSLSLLSVDLVYDKVFIIEFLKEVRSLLLNLNVDGVT